jgi:adenylate cyclase class IV
MSHQYEIEIKSLLGSKENADAFKKKLIDSAYRTDLVGANKQLNHYFVGGDLALLCDKVAPLIASEHHERLRKILTEGHDHSIRTRQKDNDVLFVVKASIDDTTSANGIARMEFEEQVSCTLDELDQILLDAGLTYQAKWSREREEFTCGDDVHVCIDRNAGYGYLVEFERVVSEDEDVDAVQSQLRALMDEFGAEELAQDRLERMFAHYNSNWQDYYGTENVFVIE